jgi:hypothetical protein
MVPVATMAVTGTGPPSNRDWMVTARDRLPSGEERRKQHECPQASGISKGGVYHSHGRAHRPVPSGHETADRGD